MNVDIAMQKGSDHRPFIFVENDSSPSSVTGRTCETKTTREKKAFYLELFSWAKINKNPIWNSPPILTHWFSLFSLLNTPASSVVNHFTITPCLPQQHSRKPNIRGHWKCQMVTAANKGKLLGHLSTFNHFFFQHRLHWLCFTNKSL